jgi:hypothetical protein
VSGSLVCWQEKGKPSKVAKPRINANDPGFLYREVSAKETIDHDAQPLASTYCMAMVYFVYCKKTKGQYEEEEKKGSPLLPI